MDTKDNKVKFAGIKHAFKSLFISISLLVLFYGVAAFITLDPLWPMVVSNAIRGVVIILYVIVTYMSWPDMDDYKSINQRR